MDFNHSGIEFQPNHTGRLGASRLGSLEVLGVEAKKWTHNRLLRMQDDKFKFQTGGRGDPIASAGCS